MLLAQLPVDSVWYLVSPQNPHKPKNGMASFEDRVAMAKLNLEGHSKLIVQDIEAKYALATTTGVIETADTLRRLARDFPDHRFIWTMGADNFVTFHTWGNSQYILDNFPIAVAPRLGHTENALNSHSASLLPHLDQASDMRWSNGWYMLKGEGNGIIATNCREELEAGQMPKFMRPEVAN